ncbi:MAG: TorF family putative porin [Gammaproteobacteria bacterium]|nr:TorF family putative porin [Gammaproteobacteria bacterium]
MKKSLVVLSALITTTPSMALDFSANAGLNSEYIFRGIPQSDGKAAAFGGFDLEQSGFYIGTWASTVDGGVATGEGEGVVESPGGTGAPVSTSVATSPVGGDGLEVDLYGGYATEIGDFSLGIGGTWYTYTDKFDDDYKELNLHGGWLFLSVDIAIGQYDNFDGPTQDYQFYSVSAEYNGAYALIGTFEDDFEGTYYEAGYGNTLAVGETELFDYNFSVIYSDDKLLGGKDDINIVAQISKNFALFSN